MNYSKIYLELFIYMFLLTVKIQAQPYIYKSNTEPNIDSVTDFQSYSIYRINLLNGQKDTISEGDKGVMWDNTQTWLINGADTYAATNLNSNQTIPLPFDPFCVVYSIKRNKIFTLGLNADNNTDALSIINCATGLEEINYYMKAISHIGKKQIFLSGDDNKLYFPFHDTVFIPLRFDKIKIGYLSTSSDKIIKTINLSDLGFLNSDGYSISAGRHGKAIITSYHFNDNARYYNIYNFDSDSSSSFVKYYGDAEPLYIDNGNYLVLAERQDTSFRGITQVLFNTGRIYIYDLRGNILVKTIQLPPRRKVYAFDNFPNNIYYYDDNTETAITLNIDSLVTNSPSANELVPAITFPSTQSFTLEVKGSKFTNNSRVFWNGSERTTTLISDSVLNAQINAADVSASGNNLVTIKTGYDISDTLTFAVIDPNAMPVHPILECVHNNGNGTYTAHFGYQNDKDKPVLIAIGGQNSIYPGQSDRGQPYLFYPGRHTDVFTVDFDGSNISWNLDMQVKSANSSSPPCQ